MKKNLLTLFLCALLHSCTPAYKYNYTLTKPIISDSLYSSNDTFDVRFVSNQKNIQFALHNKLNEPIKVVWDEATLVIQGNVYRITHANIKLSRAGESTPPTVMPQNSHLNDFLIPISNIDYITGKSGGWVIYPIFPSPENGKLGDKMVKQYLGATVMATIPISVNNTIKYYSYELTVNSIYKFNKPLYSL